MGYVDVKHNGAEKWKVKLRHTNLAVRLYVVQK